MFDEGMKMDMVVLVIYLGMPQKGVTKVLYSNMFSFQETAFVEEIRCRISTHNLRHRMCLMCVRIEMTRWLGCRS